jgi:REase_AHJR-like/Protein of unknown function DUF86
LEEALVSSSAQAWSQESQESEAQFLEGLRSRYEAEGYTFTIAPDRANLPSFLGAYEPDALAQKPGLNIAIEVKRHPSPAVQKRLQDIRRLFEGHADWRFNVVFIGTEALQWVTIPPAKLATIRKHMDEVAGLKADGHRRAAFVMAWSLLEAALHSIVGETTSKPRTPGTVVQTLAMNGYIEPDMERRMRALIGLRNRIVHGDLNAKPTSTDVDLMLSAIRAALAADAA